MNLAVICSEVPDPFQLALVEALATEATLLGHHTELFSASYVPQEGDEPKPENVFLRLPETKLFDGYVLLMAPLTYMASEQRVRKALVPFEGQPWVAIGGESWHLPSVAIDNSISLAPLMDHLYTVHGYRRFLFLLGPPTAYDARERERCLRAELALREPHIEGEFIECDFWEDHAYDAIAQRLGARPGAVPDVIVACNDNMAQGAVRALRAAGLRCPEDCAVTGFDDVEGSALEIPGLTTIRQPLAELAREALAALSGLPQAHTTPTWVRKIPTELVLRESCGCPPAELSLERCRQELIQVQHLRLKAENIRRAISDFGLAVNSAVELPQLLDTLVQSFRPLAFESLSVGLFPGGHEAHAGLPEHLREVLRLDGASSQLEDRLVSLRDFFRPPGGPPAGNGLNLVYLLYVNGKSFGLLICNIDRHWTGLAKLVANNLSNGLSRMEMLGRLQSHAADLEVAVNQRTRDLSEALRALQNEIDHRAGLEKELERERLALETILDTQPLPLAILTDDGSRIRYFNRPFLQLLNLSGEEAQVLRALSFHETFGPLLTWSDGKDPSLPYREIRLPTPTGGFVQVMARQSALVLRGEPCRIVGMMDLTQQKQLEQDLLNITERERERFGQELHDDVCQQIAALSIYTNILGSKIQSRTGEILPEVDELASLIDGILNHIRALSRGLFPIEVGTLTLDQVFDQFLIRIGNQTGLHCSLDAHFFGRTPRLGQAEQLHLFRILQEAVQNTLKHGSATALQVSLIRERQHLIFRYHDNGVGFPERPQEGVGLRSMRYRASQLGTQLVLGNAPQGGMRLELSIAMEKPGRSHEK